MTEKLCGDALNEERIKELRNPDECFTDEEHQALCDLALSALRAAAPSSDSRAVELLREARPYLPRNEWCNGTAGRVDDFLAGKESVDNATAPKQIIDPPGAAVEMFRRRHGRLPTRPGDQLSLTDRLELAAQACHAAHLLSCEATCREAATLLSETAQPDRAKGPLMIDNDRQVFFYEQDHYYLSNFSSFKVNWLGTIFDTSEHAYHWTRFPNGSQERTIIYESASAHDAFRFAQENKHWQLDNWEAVKVDVMRDILRAKAAQHEYVRRKLLQTGDRELIENSWRDPFWGWGENRDGQNMLGKLWMEVRAELRASTPSPSVNSHEEGGKHG